MLVVGLGTGVIDGVVEGLVCGVGPGLGHGVGVGVVCWPKTVDGGVVPFVSEREVDDVPGIGGLRLEREREKANR